LAAAGLGALLGVPAAHGDFIISTTTINGSVNDGISGPVGAGETEFVLSALNNGLNTTGTNLLAVDATITTSNPMVIDLTDDIDADKKADANISGFANNAKFKSGGPIPTFGVYNSGTDPDNGFAGTFVGVAQPDPGQPDDLAYANGSFGITAVQLGANIGTSNNNFYETTQGAVDPAFLNGSVTAMRIVGAFASATFKGPAANLTAIPFANIVVPTGTTGTVKVSLAGDQGASQTFTINLGGTITTVAPTPVIQLSGTAAAGSTSLGSITILGHNGSYASQTIPVTGPASTAGALTVNGFTAGDTEIYGLAASSSNLASLLSELNAALGSADAGASVVAVSSLSPSLQSVLSGDTLAAIIPGADAATPNIFSYNLTNGPSGSSISSITVVPEPTGIGALVLGGLGLLSRRKRRMA
jgi:hypothetical protein